MQSHNMSVSNGMRNSSCICPKMMFPSGVTETMSSAIHRIAEALSPEKIYLFGSHAWGEATADSDIDLFVIVKDSAMPAYRRSSEAYRALRGLRAPVEVIVRTVAEVERSKTVVSSLARKVLDHGKLLYG